MTEDQFNIRLIFERGKLFNFLIGKKVRAFGGDSDSTWYTGSEREFTITKVEADANYIDFGWESRRDLDFFSLDIYLSNYNANDTLIYTDKKFEKNINKLLPDPPLSVGYSEHGMQGPDYVNFDGQVGA